MNMQEHETPTDSFGNDMIWADSYNGFLPKSEHIPTTSSQYGVSGVTHDGDIYCVDCARDMGLIEVHDGEIKAFVDGEVIPTEKAPLTGVTLPSHESQTQMHCGRHSECLNSVDGDSHPYNHDYSIGIGIENKIIEH